MTIEELQQKGRELRNVKEDLEHAETTVSTLKERIRQIEEEHLPQMMEEAGVEGLELPGGDRILLTDFVHAKIRDEQTAFQWLRETGNDAIIKNQITCAFGRGEEEQAQRVMEDLIARRINATQKSTIHPQTLKAFVREALTNPALQQSLPRDAFGVYEGKKVIFK